jgi:RNA polymerase sigma-70 factor (ECF subfamily)
MRGFYELEPDAGCGQGAVRVLIARVTVKVQETGPKPDELSDEELLTRLRRRDEAAFTALVMRYHTRLTRLARGFVQDPSAAEEIAQETWLAVVSGIERYTGRGSLKSWIFSILANRARTRASRDGRSINFSSLSPEELGEFADGTLFDAKGYWKGDPAPWSVMTPERIALNSELAARLRAAIEELPPRLRTVVVLRDVEKLSSEEVCNALGVSETNQRVLLHRGRVQLRASLERYLAAGEGREPC